jgi:hypothetical protein
MILLMRFQNEEEFTPAAPLCNVNGVKYDIKR